MTSVPLFESYPQFVPPLSLLSPSTGALADAVPAEVDAMTALKGLDGFVLCFASLRALRGFDALTPPVVAHLLERCELERERLFELGARPIALLNARWSSASGFDAVNDALTAGVLRNIVNMENNSRRSWVEWICDKLSKMATHTPFRLSPTLPGVLKVHKKAGMMRVILKDIRLTLGDLPSPQDALRALESVLRPFVMSAPAPVAMPDVPSAPPSQVVSVARPVLPPSPLKGEVGRVTALAVLEAHLPSIPERTAPAVELKPLTRTEAALQELILPSSLTQTPLSALAIPVQRTFEPVLLQPQGPEVPLRLLSAVTALLGSSFGLWVIVEGLRSNEPMLLATGLALVLSLFALSAVLASKPRFY